MAPEGTKSILVADDDGDIRELVVFKLKQAGFDMQAATTGVEAWKAICADPPHLAVLDIMMPGLSGLEVLRRIRADDSLSGLKVILLTAISRDSDVDEGYSSGADDYVIKPFSPRELLQRVHIALGTTSP